MLALHLVELTMVAVRVSLELLLLPVQAPYLLLEHTDLIAKVVEMLLQQFARG